MNAGFWDNAGSPYDIKFELRAGALYRALGFDYASAAFNWDSRRKTMHQTPEDICADLTSELARDL